jgi:RHS repeat-associated protein
VIYGGVDGGGTNGTTDYAYQGWRVLWEKHTGDPQTFVYGNYLDEVWNRLRTDGETVSQNYYFLTAVNYSVMAVVDALGGNAIAEAYEYDAYGRHRVINKGSDATYFTSDDTYSEFPFAPGTINNSIRYTGQRFDAESNLMYYKNRYYDPSAGRFIGRDPLGWDEGPNRYGYVGGMPTMAVDPLGLQVTAPPRRPPRRPPPGTGPGGRRVKYETPDGRRTDRLPPDHWTHPIAIDPFNPGPIIIPAYPRVPPAGPMMPPTLMGPKPRTYPDTVNWPSSRGNPFNPPYRYPKKKDAKCSDWEYSVLKELVVKYCKEPPPVGCRLLDSNNREDCALIPKRIDDLFDCWRARDLMIQVCYEGIPDEGHRDARDNAERGMNNCSKKLEECKENGCFP